MRNLITAMSLVVALSGTLVAGPDQQAAPEDTLIEEPREAGDLPEAVVLWLEARDYLIPMYGELGYRKGYGNTLTGSFTGENKTDCAVLTIPRGGFEDSCSIWVFPSGDTLAPMLIAKHRVYRQGGSQWQKSYDIESELEYVWCIRPYGPYGAADLREMRYDPEKIPKMTHQGIFILLAEKDPGPYYYYDGKKWLRLPLGQ